MATTLTTNIFGASTNPANDLKKFFDTVVIEALEPNLYFEQFAEKVNVPQGHYSSRFVVENAIPTSSVTQLVEATVPTGVAISLSFVETSPTQYGINVEISDLLVLTSFFDAIESSLRMVGRAMARKIDQVIQTVVNAGTQVIYPGTITSRSGIGANDKIDVSLLGKAAWKLRGNSAPEFSERGGYYVAVMHSNVAHDLTSNVGVGQWLDVHKYANPENIFRGELGMIHGIRLVQSSNVQTFTSTVTVYPTTVISQGAYRVSYWLGERAKIYVLPPEQNLSNTNPLGQLGNVGAKTVMGVARVQEERIVRIETAASSL